MDVFSCPKGHSSSEADFCSECGAKIAGSASAFPSPVKSGAKTGPVCPDCGAPRIADEVVFCEVCGYNFSNGAQGEIPLPPASPARPLKDATPPETQVTVTPESTPSSSAPPPPEAEIPKSRPAVWRVVVTVDPTLREPGSPEPPAGMGPFPFEIDKPVNLIGRHSSTRAIDPEIPLDFDEAVSHRHAILNRGEDGMLAVRDIGSSNGTMLNGAAVTPMTDTPLRDGDQITLGHWTRITVKAE